MFSLDGHWNVGKSFEGTLLRGFVVVLYPPMLTGYQVFVYLYGRIWTLEVPQYACQAYDTCTMKLKALYLRHYYFYYLVVGRKKNIIRQEKQASF